MSDDAARTAGGRREGANGPAPRTRERRRRRSAEGTAPAAGRARASALSKRELLGALRALKRGELAVRLPDDLDGIDGRIAEVFNDLALQVASQGAEFATLRQVVGRDGRTRQRMRLGGLGGGWADQVRSVNDLLDDLTNHTDQMARVVAAVSRGDLTHRIDATPGGPPLRGDFLEHARAVNEMVEQLGLLGSELTRVAQEVGIEGKLGAQADVRGVSGTWRDLTDAVNSMASNLTDQVRSISQVATAIAEGDLRKKIEVDAKGEILELKSTINTMVEQLRSFAEEVTRVAREVGTEGRLGGQASVEGVRGTWKELTDNVNLMASNLTNQVRDISGVATAIASGDLGRKITVEVRGELLELKNTVNTMVDQLSSFADEVTRVARDVGEEGKLGGQAEVAGVLGIWKELTDNVNLMASNLTNQVRDIAQVTTAVANGDLSKVITVEVRGEILELKNTINTMVGQLRSFADEVTRVAREVGTEGILGGQAEVRGVSGTWRELTDNVNIMARNLTEQVRGIARVVTAVANGDLKQQLHLEAKGEIATLVRTINDMLVTLSTFADQVTDVARDVGAEGKLGGQADVPGAAGIWRDLTNNVNELAGNLTRQVRAIGDVATAVTKGDLTQTIDVEARGEVALLKDNINQMIRTLAETTRVNEEQDWLKTNLTRFTRMLQGQRDLQTVTEQVLSELASVVEAQHGALYMTARTEETAHLELYSTYAFTTRKGVATRFEVGESLVGQAARERKRILVREVPADYVQIGSGLGHATPLNLVVVPILFEGEVRGVIELASFCAFTPIQLDFLDQLIDSLGIVLATIEATMRTGDLLRQSQSMAEQLQTQQEELRQTNDQLEEKARQLTLQKEEVEHKNQEVELARQELEEQAEQLSLTSKYKSAFLANMSHELRTPLNSLLILSRQLAQNSGGNLDEKQVQYAQTIHDAGADLLALINEILDLAKIESGTMGVTLGTVELSSLVEYVLRSFRQVALEQGLELGVSLAEDLPPRVVTDEQRLRQVLRNLISNAIKFTDEGHVEVRIERAPDRGADVIAFRVRDTGIGIPRELQAIIFEAFQQADGSTSRRHGGTGLGLSISREIARLLGGQLEVVSEVGAGSTFSLYLPVRPPLPTDLSRRAEPAAAPLAPGVRPSAAPPEKPDRERAADALDTRERPLAGATVLIVDDDVRNLFAVTALLETHGVEVLHAETGQDAVDRIAGGDRIDAVLMDIMMPGMDGFEATRRIRRIERGRALPIIALTAKAMKGDREKCLAAGLSDYVTKPVDPDELVRTLGEWLEERATPAA